MGRPKMYCQLELIERRREQKRADKLRNQQRDRDYYYAHREERLRKSKAYREQNKDTIRERRKKRRQLPSEQIGNKRRALAWHYGITLERYEELKTIQASLCAICRQPEITKRRGKILPLHVDHDHQTGEIRGLLCARCNRGIGDFREDLQIMDAALKYLEFYKKKELKEIV